MYIQIVYIYIYVYIQIDRITYIYIELYNNISGYIYIYIRSLILQSDLETYSGIYVYCIHIHRHIVMQHFVALYNIMQHHTTSYRTTIPTDIDRHGKS